MKISFSKPNSQTGKRHLIVDMTHAEDRNVYEIVRKYILDGKRPIRQVQRTKVRYRFPKKFLDTLQVTFPFAEFSEGIETKVMKSEKIVYAPEDIPELVLPGFHAEKLEPDHDLFPFQKVSIADLMQREVPLTDGMGLGKTLQGLAVQCGLELAPTLIICPNSAKWVWEYHIEEYTELTHVLIDGNAQQRRAQIEKQAHTYIINFEALRLHPELADYQWAFCIVDEFHRMKNPTAKVTQAFQQLSYDRLLPMSGTPIINRPEESWVILNSIWPDRYPSYYTFCHNLLLRAGQRGITVGYHPKRMRNLRSFIQKNSIRRRKEQVIDELPQEINLVREFELYPEQRKLYKEILKEGKLRMASGEIKQIRDFRSLHLRLRQACFSPELYGGPPKSRKVEEIKDLARELVDNNEKAIIFSQWRRATNILRRELAEYNPAYVDSTVKGRDRKEQERKFNHDPACQLYIGTIGANREAISLGAGTYVIFADEDWSPLYNDQAQSRSASGGLRGMGKEKVTIVRLYARDTVEREVAELLRQKLAIFNMLIERDGGKRVERSLLADLANLFEKAK